jgi:hypothetical protein
MNRRRRRLERLRAAPFAIRSSPPADGGVDQPPEPPACPPGWSIGPPDFVGVGVQRCGTSRWYRLIADHPDVVGLGSGKELHYFDRFHSGGWKATDAADYHRYFPRPEGHIAGEWTPAYASAPWVPQLLAQSAPDARLLVLLRDPLERFLSGLQLDATVAARRGMPLSRYAPYEAFVRGLYHAQLTQLLRYFEREQVLVLQYERCVQQPATELNTTFEFLGLDASAVVPNLERHPRQQENKPIPEPEMSAAYVAAYEDDVMALATRFAEIDLSLWPNFAHLAK